VLETEMEYNVKEIDLQKKKKKNYNSKKEDNKEKDRRAVVYQTLTSKPLL